MQSSTLKVILRVIGILVLVGCIIAGFQLGDMIRNSFVGIMLGIVMGIIPCSLLFVVGNIAADIEDIKGTSSLLYRSLDNLRSEIRDSDGGKSISAGRPVTSSHSMVDKLRNINEGNSSVGRWSCKKCGEVNDDKSMYCKNCGEYK